MLELGVTIVLVIGGAFFTSLWALVDIIRRPNATFRVAGTSKGKWSLTFSTVVAGLVAAFAVVANVHFHGPITFAIALFAAPMAIIGLAAAAAYLGIVRRWVGAQLMFAEQATTQGGAGTA
jgi:multisubunit Na+/H+ antiporter MnhG subunit